MCRKARSKSENATTVAALVKCGTGRACPPARKVYASHVEEKGVGFMRAQRKTTAKRASAMRLPRGNPAKAYAIRVMGFHEWYCASDYRRDELTKAFRAGAAWKRRQKDRK